MPAIFLHRSPINNFIHLELCWSGCELQTSFVTAVRSCAIIADLSRPVIRCESVVLPLLWPSSGVTNVCSGRLGGPIDLFLVPWLLSPQLISFVADGSIKGSWRWSPTQFGSTGTESRPRHPHLPEHRVAED